jgi:iron complex outermembrane receptor protein
MKKIYLGSAVAMIGSTALAASAAAQERVEEIVVTASKTGESVRDIAGSVSALTGEALSAMGAESAEDYLTRIPGVVFNAAAPGASTVTIRGIATTNGVDQGQGTTGIYINDVPLTDPYFSTGTPDIDTFDVEHVEVFRGPQGTLFGSASLGGAVNFVTRRPDLTRGEAAAQLTQSSTRHGDINSAYKLMLNLPVVEDRFAVRAVAALRRDSGYLDNIGTVRSEANESRVAGGRMMADWVPRTGTRISWFTLWQETQIDDGFYRIPELGDFMRSTATDEEQSSDVTLHGLRLDQDFGFAALTALASYHKKTQEGRPDFTARFGDALFGGLSGPVTIVTPLESDGMTYEARLVSPRGSAFEWLVGAMYDKTQMQLIERGEARGAAGALEAGWGEVFGSGIGALAAPNDLFHRSEVDFQGEEMALFGEAAYRLTDRFKLTLGGRLFETRTNFAARGTGFLNLISEGSLDSSRQGDQKESGFNPKGALSYDFTDDMQVYALASKGFRFGGPNVLPPLSGFATPPEFVSDALVNYELGVKTAWFDDTLILDATAFHIDWSDIQLRFLRPDGLFYADNAGKARVWGVEAALSWQVTANLGLQSNVTWLDAKTRDDFNSGFGPIVAAGARLPGAAEWQVANLLSYSFDLPGAPFVSVAHRYISQAPSSLQFDLSQGDYNLFDLRVGFSIDRFQLAIFAANITDEAGVTSATFVPQTAENRQYILRPRTVGLTLDWKM